MAVIRATFVYLLLSLVPALWQRADAGVLHTSSDEAVSDTRSSGRESAACARRPILALKTNLLFDALTAVNIQVEVPIGNRFSVAGEWIFPNWVDRETNKYCLQADILSLEGRWWLGDRASRDVLTGHFLGVYGQKGDFDFQPWTEDGWQCENGWAAGVSYGFAHTINRAGTLRLEYSIGIGYAWADYRQYRREAFGEIIATRDEWHYNASFFPIPTRASVSFVWLITCRRKAE